MIGSKNKKGFTIVELLVAITLFVLVVAAVGGLSFSGFQNQRRSLAAGSLFNETSFLMEYMSRYLRMAKRELDPPVCLSEKDLNYEITRSGKGIKFISSSDECLEFYWDTATNRLKENSNGDIQFLTAADSKVVNFRVSVSGARKDDNLQPQVTFFLNLEKTGTRPESISSLKLQTTVSQRNRDVNY